MCLRERKERERSNIFQRRKSARSRERNIGKDCDRERESEKMKDVKRVCVFSREREKGGEIKRELEKGETGRQREKANALFSSARESISMLLPTPSTRVDLIRQFSSSSGSHVIQCLTQKIFFCLLLKIFVVKGAIHSYLLLLQLRTISFNLHQTKAFIHTLPT